MINIDTDFGFSKNDKIVIGCSTGPDSMALLDMLLKVRDKYSLSLIVAHVNHNVRKESVTEEAFLKKYCEEKELIFESMTIEEYGDDNFHNEARNIRYNFFEMVVLKYEANYLMTAHHGDDLMETVLMRLVRGSNLNGYSGFRKIVDMGNYKIVRPLIKYTKEELIKYDEENEVKYFIDSSNSKDKYTRNRYRKYVLPFLKEEDSNVHLKFLKFSDNLHRAYEFIEKERDKALKRVLDGEKILIDKFLLEDEFIQKEIIYYFLNMFYQDDLILVNDRHIDLIFSLIRSRKANSFVNLPNLVIASKTYNVLELKRDTFDITSYEIELSDSVLLPNNMVIEMISDVSDNSNYICRLNSKEVSLPLIVRSRRFGDRMKIKGLNGSKKVKDIFIDKKISIEKRELWPVVTDSRGEIVWIPGLKKSKFDKKKNESYDIVLKYD